MIIRSYPSFGGAVEGGEEQLMFRILKKDHNHNDCGEY